MRFVVVLVLLAIAPAAWSQAAGQGERSPLDVIEQCGDSADEESTGLTALEEECPGLTRALEQSGYLPLLSTASVTSWTSTILPTCCRSMPGTRRRRRRTVDVGTLGPILDSLQAQEPERPLGWFERFKRWLRSMLERRGGSSDNWLSRWLEEADVSDVVAKGMLYVALATDPGVDDLRDRQRAARSRHLP